MHLNNILEEVDDLKKSIDDNFLYNLELKGKEKLQHKILIQQKVNKINLKLNDFNNSLDSILKTSNKGFDFKNFIESLKNTSTFEEINPKIEFEKATKILKNIQEKKEIDRIENERRTEKQKLFTKKRSEEANQKYLNGFGRNIIKDMYYNGPENILILNSLKKRGYDFSDSIYPLITLINRGRTINFIKFLIKNGLKLNRSDILSLKNKKIFENQNFFKVVYDAKQIDNTIVNEILKGNE